MSTPTFTIGKGTLLPEIQLTCSDAAGTPVNLTGLSVTFRMRHAVTGVLKVNAAATLVTPASGLVKYVWTGTDTDTAGVYYADCLVTFGDLRTEPFPTPDPVHVTVTETAAG